MLLDFLKTLFEICIFLKDYILNRIHIDETEHGGDIVASVLKSHGVAHVFTLCGGHISSLLVGCEKKDIKVIDCRNEATAAFAAEAYGRINSIGVVMVTAGPGFTNTITTMRNASLSESPVLFIAGAVAKSLRGRGSLQDCDQLGLARHICKYTTTIRRVRHIIPELIKAIKIAKSGVPGPVFIEMAVDILYPYSIIREEMSKFTKSKTLINRIIEIYLDMFSKYLFDSPRMYSYMLAKNHYVKRISPSEEEVLYIVRAILASKKPVIIVGTQSLVNGIQPQLVRHALQKLGIPTYLSGMARGLLNKYDENFYRQNRSQILRESDLVLLAGVICDFRMSYGSILNKKAKVISVNLSREKANLNNGLSWKCNRIVCAHPGEFLMSLSASMKGIKYQVPQEWNMFIVEKEVRIVKTPVLNTKAGVDPVALFTCLDEILLPNSVIIGDGGDFVATASYILNPRNPLSWFDAGPYGTLGTGAGYGLASSLKQDSEVWIIYGDGSCGYSIIDIDTFVRHGLRVIMVIGNDGGWTQILRGQVSTFKTDVACRLESSRYEKISQAFNAEEIFMDQAGDDNANIIWKLQQARTLHKSGRSVIINVILEKSDFRCNAISF